MPLKTYRDLDVWKVSMDLVDAIYDLTEKLPSHQRYTISSQIERAALSIPLNIAEGYGRIHTGEYLHHLSYSQGSNREVETLLIIVARPKYVEKEELKTAWELTQRVGMMLTKLIKSLKK
ncbi:MAG: four helix bundle protein [Bacteroidota bacterium]|nr:four helix bundle protein [Bacteroidota bacterium]MDP4230669.1 four helix bundle protein [Bacteroidota bacterium]MDP4235359.1 four helix bundle protein [Bacteroidota bacterium]